jgi:hypothetical protein
MEQRNNISLFCSHHGGVLLLLPKLLPLIVIRSTTLWVFQQAASIIGS